MRNFKNNRRRFRSNSFERNIKIRQNDQSINSGLENISDFRRKNFSKNQFNSTKLIQKYSDLAREALSTGDKISYENYLQHAEHFIRVSNSGTNHHNEKNLTSKLQEESNIAKIEKGNLNEENNLEAKDINPSN